MQATRGAFLKLAVYFVAFSSIHCMETFKSLYDDSETAEDHRILISMGSLMNEKVEVLTKDVETLNSTLINAIEKGYSLISKLPSKDQWNEVNAKISKLLLLQNQSIEVAPAPEPTASTRTTVPRKATEFFRGRDLTTVVRATEIRRYIDSSTTEASRTNSEFFYHGASTESDQVTSSCYEATKNASLGSLLKIDASIYYVIREKLSWYDANSKCIEIGMEQLASFDLLNHLQHVAALLLRIFDSKKGPLDFWVSASDIGQTPGQFIWADNRTVATSFWDKTNNDPNNFGANNETCVYLHAREKLLCDSPCSYRTHALCEVPDHFARCFL